MKKRLLVNADDLGYSQERNEGIIKCYKAGVISRASLIMNAAAVEGAASLIKLYNFPTGLHMNLTEGHPISDRTLIPSLLTQGGSFHDKQSIRDKNRDGLIIYEEVAIEIQAQIEEYIRLIGQVPAFSDGHQHVHLLPGIRDVYASVLNDYGIKETRVPAELDLGTCDWLSPDVLAFVKTVISEATEAAKVFQCSSIRYTEGFVGLFTLGSNMTLDRVKDMILRTFQHLDHGQEQIVVEFMVHPGYPTGHDSGGCGQGPDDFAKSSDRLHEINFLTSQEFLSFLQQAQISVLH